MKITRFLDSSRHQAGKHFSEQGRRRKNLRFWIVKNFTALNFKRSCIYKKIEFERGFDLKKDK